MTRDRSTSIKLGRYSSSGHEDLRVRLERLRTISGTPIKQLQDAYLLDYQAVTVTIQSTLETESWPEIYRQIKEVFANVKPIPGTVGGYFAGCFHNSFPSAPGCSLTCVGSVPAPGTQDCKHVVIQATYVNGYIFNTLNGNNIQDYSNAYIYLDVTSLTAFRGFSEAEIQTLQAMGIQHVALISAPVNGEYINLTGGFVIVTDLPTRSGSQPTPNNGGGFNWWILIIIIIIILILVKVASCYKC